VKVNCGAISPGLLESELFGHVKGALAGAVSRRTGRFELADGGTIFLEEVSELTLEMQLKLLRVLREQVCNPAGSNNTVHVDVRVIAATHRDLDALVKSGLFRADLHDQLNAVPIYVPPLRERHGDIPKLAAYFLQRLSRERGSRVSGISRESLDLLCHYHWPGNVRELRNIIQRAALLATGPVLHLDPNVLAMPRDNLLRSSMDARLSWPQTSAQGRMSGPPWSLEEAERHHILEALERSHWVIEGPSGAAIALQRHPSTLRGRMRKLGISRTHH
jgi:formate hydrogenlyase transcriptional activator